MKSSTILIFFFLGLASSAFAEVTPPVYVELATAVTESNVKTAAPLDTVEVAAKTEDVAAVPAVAVAVAAVPAAPVYVELSSTSEVKSAVAAVALDTVEVAATTEEAAAVPAVAVAGAPAFIELASSEEKGSSRSLSDVSRFGIKASLRGSRNEVRQT